MVSIDTPYTTRSRRAPSPRASVANMLWDDTPRARSAASPASCARPSARHRPSQSKLKSEKMAAEERRATTLIWPSAFTAASVKSLAPWMPSWRARTPSTRQRRARSFCTTRRSSSRTETSGSRNWQLWQERMRHTDKADGWRMRFCFLGVQEMALNDT